MSTAQISMPAEFFSQLSVNFKKMPVWAQSTINSILGMSILLFMWWIGGLLIANNPDTEAFADFAPGPALSALWALIGTEFLNDTIISSLERIIYGLFWGIVIGVPLGVLMGYFVGMRQVANMPFQFLRMISPLAWMPIAVLAYDTWDGAIIFLIVMATVWPIVFGTAHGVQRIDPNWFRVARNLGADGFQMLRRVIMPAIAQDVFAGIRLAVGVAWVVLVPAEYLGVTSGLGYAINDARDTLAYDTLAAMVVVIGVIGYLLDAIAVFLIKRYSWHAS
ncbi:ABC transporter permease [Thiomicrorhabdus xiamenensis]|uniref:ABC transporter permease n=1 Tax=Thiomicrorhabdus xiamenensis TaxID=2739063 RepID=A0A7D4NS57_9GAMM|nr:ABC transporter permease [Thiomicrorhabdus xiamenensis]QKI90170.1 ABC transporter permease [Thiomicrorhabdus xiamenensis]